MSISSIFDELKVTKLFFLDVDGFELVNDQFHLKKEISVIVFLKDKKYSKSF